MKKFVRSFNQKKIY